MGRSGLHPRHLPPSYDWSEPDTSYSGYAAPENLQNYAAYLDSRIKAYHDLKHDAIRVQAESNRDLRNNSSIEEDAYQSGSHHRGKNGASSKPAPSGPTRSKTIMGRKLRVMTVEKGLLRETRVVQKMIDTLVECRVRSLFWLTLPGLSWYATYFLGRRLISAGSFII